MIEFSKTVSAPEQRSSYLNLKDDYGRRYGNEFPPHATPFVVIDGLGRHFNTTQHHAQQLWGNLVLWFLANDVRAGTRITVKYDPNERVDGQHIVRLIPHGSTTQVPAESVSSSIEDQNEEEEVQRFGLERHLHEFLRDNWNATELACEWIVHKEEGHPQAGYEYPTDIGRIDLLAKHKREPRWLVIELKRGQTGDDTVGQVLRYMGWVRKHLAKEAEQVEGLIIAHEADDGLRYAINEVKNVKLMLYDISFSLKPQ
jgi:hypothetical protein